MKAKVNSLFTSPPLFCICEAKFLRPVRLVATPPFHDGRFLYITNLFLHKVDFFCVFLCVVPSMF